jgi:hypothetical protein
MASFGGSGASLAALSILCAVGALVHVTSAAPAPPQDVQPRDCNPVTDDPLHGGLPYFDARCDSRGIATPAVRQAIAAARARSGDARAVALDALGARVPCLAVELDPCYGMPQWLGSTLAFLTDPAPGTDAKDVTKAFMSEYPALVEADPAELDKARVVRDFLTDHNGVRHLTFRQQIGGVDLFECEVRANVMPDGRLINFACTMLPRPAGDFVVTPPRLTDLDAVRIAAENAGVAYTQVIQPKTDQEGPSLKRTWNNTGDFRADEPIVTELVYFAATRDPHDIRTAWSVVVPVKGVGHTYDILIDAQTGELLRRMDRLVWDNTPMTFRVFTSDSPAPDSPGPSTPNGYQAPEVPRMLLTVNPADIAAYSPDGWIATGSNDTHGNNVDAHLDLNNDNLPDLPRPDGGAARTFDFPFDSSQPPSSWRDFAVTQLFWRANSYHDQLMQLGFNEAAHNFQTTNFTGQGTGNDAIQADAQDGGGINNANFATTGDDGSSARVQMYVFTGPSPARDGDVDSEIAFHEFTHGTSIRLSGGLGGMYQSPGMGEGWSDFVALNLLAEPGDDPDACYAMGAYITYLFSAGFVNNYYFGIRRFPYSVDMNKNPLTFADIQTLTYDTSIPANPIFVGNSASEVHSEGEVWCNMLLDCRAQLWHAYGFPGNRRMLQLVIDGLKLTGENPTFQIARDAILQADMVDYGNVDTFALWQAFARHGLGYSSNSPNGYNSVSGIVEAYDVAQYVTFSYPDGVPTQLDPQGPTTFRVRMMPTLVTLTPNTATLHYAVNGGADNQAPLTDLGNNTYRATIPAQACFANVSFYVAVGTSVGTSSDPHAAPASAYPATVFQSTTTWFADDMETDRGWTVSPGTPPATTGIWNRMAPQQTAAQPGADHTPGAGTMCWVTDGRAGSSAGSNDVDGGQTILTSPVINLAGAPPRTVVSYWRWFSNDQGLDPDTQTFLVDVSVNNGASWTRAETVGPATQNSGGWLQGSWTFASLGLTPSAQVKLRFTAQDMAAAIVEAAVDDVLIQSINCTTPPPCGSADFNCDGDVATDADIEAFFSCLAGNCPPPPCASTADFNGDGDGGTDADIEAFFRVLAGGSC